MLRNRIISLMTLILAIVLHASALEVGHLRVQSIQNPSGIDTDPSFSWQLQSTDRSVMQTAYKITIATADGTVVYDGQYVDSDQSTGVVVSGLNLEPSTRYFWTVSVKDNLGNEATSTETAWFDTGLMSDGWGDAQWIKATKNKYTYSDSVGIVAHEYTIEARMRIEELAGGIIFAASDRQNYYMWQVRIYNGTMLLRPHRWQSNNPACLAEVSIPAETGLELNKDFTLRIEVSENGKRAITYINDVRIDDRTGEFQYGLFGIRASHDFGEVETASYDYLRVTSTVAEEEFYFDFSDENPMTAGEVSDGYLHMTGSLSEDLYAWKKAASNNLHYIVEADMTLVRDNAAIVFAATGSKTYHMWQINTFDGTNPLVRPHIYINSTDPIHQDFEFTQFTKDDLLNHKRHVSIEVIDDEIITSIDGVEVNRYVDNTGTLALGDIGLRVDNTATTPKEEAIFDNLKLTVYDEQGNASVRVNETFDDPSTCIFLAPKLVEQDGSMACLMDADGKENRMMQESADGLPLFRKNFVINKDVKSAFLYTTALGVYDLYLNNQRVGAVQPDGTTAYDELKPGWTAYKHRVFYNQYEVSSLLQTGDNAVGAMVAPGWWAGAIAKGYYGTPNTAFKAKLVINYTDGTQDVVNSDLSWAVSYNNPLRSGEIYDGEIYDARKEWAWTTPGESLDNWYAVEYDGQFSGEITSSIGQPVREMSWLKQTPKSTTIYEGVNQTGTTYGEINIVNTIEASQSLSLKAGQTAIIDFGQNMAGWLTFSAKGTGGTRLHVRFAEILNDTGDEGRRNDGPGGSIYVENLRTAKAELYYTLAGNADGDTYKPSTTFWGFRYCEITASADVELEDLAAVPVSSSYIDAGAVETSSDIVNQLFSNVVWGQRSNLLSVPTDCPQRDERLGWSADTQVFSATGMLNADVASFYRKWMTDMRDDQRSDGAFPNIAPLAWVIIGDAGWSDAGIIVPWNIYQATGDKEVIRENYTAMEKYMDWMSQQSSDGYQYQGAGTQYGDWLSFTTTDPRMVSVAYYAYDAMLMSKMAAVLSETEGDSYDLASKAYDQLHSNIRDEYQGRYVNSNGYLNNESQTGYLMMLRFNLYKDEDQKQKAIKSLSELITSNNEKLSTGFLGTSMINQVLSEVGLNDKAYNLLLQRECPSWLYSVDQGATTIWERWDSYTIENGFNTPDMNSFNHYSYGAVAEWMYRYMAGINHDEENAGYKNIILKPCIDSRTELPEGQERITSVSAHHDSPYGTISSAWKSVDGELTSYDVTVPANTNATVYIPAKTEDVTVQEGDVDAASAEGVTYKGYVDGYHVYSVGSGVYKFTTDVSTGIKNATASSDSFRVTPNPVEDILTIVSDNSIDKVEVYNMSGALVRQISQDGVESVDMSGLSRGEYVLRANAQENSYITKVIKK